MNLYTLLQKHHVEQGPLRVGLIGAGKFGTMFLAQALRTKGLHVAAIADLDPGKVKDNLKSIGWDGAQINAATLNQAITTGATCVLEDAASLIESPKVDVVIEATGHPPTAITHAKLALSQGKHLVMVSVEADALAGPLLAREFAAAGLVYSLAYGDQPALIAEQVDWARACGLSVVAAGKGTKYLPHFHASTPETVWRYYGLSESEAAAGGMNPQMFNSFLDGTKSAIEMAAVANACDLAVAPEGLAFPPCGTDSLPEVLKPAAVGGTLAQYGQVEVISSLERDGSPVAQDLRWGVFVVFEAPSDYVARCFKEYGLITDRSAQFSALYKPYHLIGLELGISVLSAGLRGEATGAPRAFRGDVVAVAKRDLLPGEVLDGEGGYRVWGKLFPASQSIRIGALPIGLAQGITIKRRVPAGSPLCWEDVNLDPSDPVVKLRRDMEKTCLDADQVA
ncbi:MAG: Gfo/Idh/MocA family oxidoreductase [Pseudomonadota bacterium]